MNEISAGQVASRTWDGSPETPADTIEMRNWLKELAWADDDPEDLIDEATDEEICRAVNRQYDGGLAGFQRDSNATVQH